MIVAIEGGVGAGKTTLLHGLSLALPDFDTIPEYFDIIPVEEHEHVLKMSEAEKFTKFVQVERDRLSYLSNSSHNNFLLDRSFLTLLSYQHSIDRLSEVNFSVFTPSYMKENFILPDLVIHLDVEDDLRIQRVRERGYDGHSKNL